MRDVRGSTGETMAENFDYINDRIYTTVLRGSLFATHPRRRRAPKSRDSALLTLPADVNTEPLSRLIFIRTSFVPYLRAVTSLRNTAN